VPDHPANQGGVLRLAGTQRHVKAGLDQIHHVIRDRHVQRNVRIAKLELGIHMRQQRRANPRRAGDAQPPAGVFAQALNGVLRPLAGRQHLAAVHQIVLARKRQVEPARGAVKQANAHLLLQLANPLAHAGFWQFRLLRCRGKAAHLGHQREQRHILQLFKHDCSSCTNAEFLIVHLITQLAT
jgi:hypothetical protein